MCRQRMPGFAAAGDGKPRVRQRWPTAPQPVSTSGGGFDRKHRASHRGIGRGLPDPATADGDRHVAQVNSLRPPVRFRGVSLASEPCRAFALSPSPSLPSYREMRKRPSNHQCSAAIACHRRAPMRTVFSTVPHLRPGTRCDGGIAVFRTRLAALLADRSGLACHPRARRCELLLRTGTNWALGNWRLPAPCRMFEAAGPDRIGATIGGGAFRHANRPHRDQS